MLDTAPLRFFGKIPAVRRIFRGIGSASRRATSSLSSFTFIQLHYAYFIITCLIFSGIFYGCSRPEASLGYTDCLFLVVSAMTLTGLNTVNLSTLNTVQQFILFFLIIIGSAIFVSSFVVHVRKNAFEHRVKDLVELRKKQRQSMRRRFSRSRSRLGSRASQLQSLDELNLARKESMNQDAGITTSADLETPSHGESSKQPEYLPNYHDSERPDLTTAIPLENMRPTFSGTRDDDEALDIQTPDLEASRSAHITFDTTVQLSRIDRFLPKYGVGAHSTSTTRRRFSNQSTIRPSLPAELGPEPASGLPFPSAGYVSRNSQMHHLSEKDRKALGGYEYRAICLLSWLVPVYFVLFQLLGCLGLGAYVAHNKASATRENGLDPWWVGAFNAVSAFNNSGMSLLDANMIAFQTSVYMLLTMGFLILAGNTCYPIFLRLIVWSFRKLLPHGKQWEDHRKTLQFLLDHPRRCYTNMFPAWHTWWLLCAVLILNGIDWVAFEVLNIGNHNITHLPVGIRVVDGLFQALAVRSGGFYVVPIPSVRISLQVLYVIMMYISVYPVVITMRNTNVYEERSLGIYADDPGYAAEHARSAKGLFGSLSRVLTTTPWEETTQYFIRQQLRAQLSHDIWLLVLAIFIIMIIEAAHFESDPVVFSVFNVIFETVSAYGCVGISVGLPDQAYSFSGALRTGSKLVLCVVMLRGRHRGLPVAIDKAILLPDEEVDGVGGVEEEDEEIRLERSVSRGRVA
jgi:Trk-type K+ transport system membrane component